MRKQPKCPEAEKLAAVSEDSNKIGGFLSWLSSQGVYLAEYDESDNFVRSSDYKLTDYGINRILAEYYGIDLDEVERERRALLDWLREVQGG